MPKSKKKKGDKQKKAKVSYIYRKRGKKAISENLINALKPTESDVVKLLAAQVHIGRRKAHVNMKRYIWKRREDGVHIINLQKTWAKLVLAARILVTIDNPKDICVMSTRTFGQRGAIKFAHHTGATAIVGKWVPGSFTNPKNERAFKEPRLLIVDDPNTCFAALRETSYVGIPTIAFSGVDCNLRFVDCCIPMNNRGKYSIGLMFYLLAREYKRMKGEISRDQDWSECVDLFFYRTQDEVMRQEKEKQKQRGDEQNQDGSGNQYGFDGVNDYDDDTKVNQAEQTGTNVNQGDNNNNQTNNNQQDMGWDDNPPDDMNDDDDDWGNNNPNPEDGGVDYDQW